MSCAALLSSYLIIPLRGRILRSRLGRFNRPGRRLRGVAEAGGVYAEARDLILIRVVIQGVGEITGIRQHEDGLAVVGQRIAVLHGDEDALP